MSSAAAMLEAMRDFNACVLAKGDAAHFSSSLPLYSRCVNTSCLLSAHEQIGTAPIASNVSRGGEIGQLPAISPPHKPPPTSRITEYDCHSADDEELAVTSARARGLTQRCRHQSGYRWWSGSLRFRTCKIEDSSAASNGWTGQQT